ncbi:hypothetical protein EYF80_050026 [Liparis tanakae]|uniref:Uncharacterized protein n=1 Tax=Liparis tanakae TaxID=230148 RepID=A0A4Z2FFU6_9TELE|nr:hypothetical protein EYF80_050026 [Liparis tanakae]
MSSVRWVSLDPAGRRGGERGVCRQDTLWPGDPGQTAGLSLPVGTRGSRADGLRGQLEWEAQCSAILPAEPGVGRHTGGVQVRGGIIGMAPPPLQLGETVRLRRQLQVRHLRMLMVMCMRGPKLKRRL